MVEERLHPVPTETLKPRISEPVAVVTAVPAELAK
jgi:hypothetical protein